MKSVKHYAVYFTGVIDHDMKIDGYFAESQLYYSWSFTTDIDHAKLWKTIDSAINKVNSTVIYSDLDAKVVEVEVHRSVIKDTTTISWEKITENIRNQIEFKSLTTEYLKYKPRNMDMYGFVQTSSKRNKFKTVWEYYCEPKNITYILTEDINKQIISGKIK